MEGLTLIVLGLVAIGVAVNALRRTHYRSLADRFAPMKRDCPLGMEATDLDGFNMVLRRNAPYGCRRDFEDPRQTDRRK